METGLGWNLKRACNRKRETHIRIWQFPVINLAYGRGIRFASRFKIYLCYTFAFARVYNDFEMCVKVRGMRKDSILEFEKIESFRSTVLFTSLFYIWAQFYWSSRIVTLTLSTSRFRNSVSEKCKNSLVFWHLK